MKKLIFIAALIISLGFTPGRYFVVESHSEGQTQFEQQEQNQYTEF